MSTGDIQDLALSPGDLPLPVPVTASARSLRPRTSASRGRSNSRPTESTNSSRHASLARIERPGRDEGHPTAGRSNRLNLSTPTIKDEIDHTVVNEPSPEDADVQLSSYLSAELSELSDLSEDHPPPVPVPRKRNGVRQASRQPGKRQKTRHPQQSLHALGAQSEELLPDPGAHLASSASHHLLESHAADVIYRGTAHLSSTDADDLLVPLPVERSTPTTFASLIGDVIDVDQDPAGSSQLLDAPGQPEIPVGPPVASSSRLGHEPPPAVQNAAAPPTASSAIEPLSSYSCPICFSPPTYATLTPCGHVCCGECLFTAVKTAMQRATYQGPVGERLLARCPVCRAPIPGWDGRGGGVIGMKPRTVITL